MRQVRLSLSLHVCLLQTVLLLYERERRPRPRAGLYRKDEVDGQTGHGSARS